MAILGVFVKLSAIILVTMATSIKPIAGQLIVTALVNNNATINDTDSCQMSTNGSSVSIRGSSNQMCSLRVSAQSESSSPHSLGIKLQLFGGPTSDGTVLYVERVGMPSNACRSRFVAITPTPAGGGHCENVFLHKDLQINLRGDISFSISEVLEENLPHHKCPEDDDSVAPATQVNWTSLASCHVQGFDDVVACSEVEDSSGACSFAFPDHCNVTLGNKEASGTPCLNQIPDIHNKDEVILMIYPSPLYELDLSDNNIGAITVDAFHDGLFTNLRSLILDYNHLADVPQGTLTGLVNLKSLSLSQNKLNVLHGGLFKDQHHLVFLALDHNKLKTLPLEVFQGLEQLIQLYLHGNELVELNSGLFDGLVNLRVLLLYSNRLVALGDTLFSDLTTLNVLVISYNQLTRFPSLDGMKSLDTIYLSTNQLTNLDFEIFKDARRLSKIDLSSNNLLEIPDIQHLSRLSFLDLQDNPLTKLNLDTFSMLPSQPMVLYVDQHEICECYVSGNTSCSAADDRSPYLSCDRLLSDKVLAVMMWLIGLNALCGNAFVLMWRKKKGQKNKVQDYLLSNLAMSDFLMGVYMVIIGSADIYFGDYFPMRSESWRTGITCRIAGALSILSSEASVFFVTIISLDRLVSIRSPQSRRRLGVQSTIITSILTWIFSVALGTIPSIFSGVNMKFYDNSHVCIGLPLALTQTYTAVESTKLICSGSGSCYEIQVLNTDSGHVVQGMYFSSVTFLGLNSICYFIILLCYVEVVRIVYKSSKRAGLNKEMKEQMRLTAKVAAIVATDFATWCPIIIMGILVQTRVVTLPPSVYAWSVTFVLPINSAINPYLYTIAAIISSRRKRKVGEDSSTTKTRTTKSEQRPTAPRPDVDRTMTSSIDQPNGQVLQNAESMEVTHMNDSNV